MIVAGGDIEARIRAATQIEAAGALLPELRLHLATEPRELLHQAVDARAEWLPYWAFAWPGGQALARHVLDHSEIVAGRRVLDVGAGSGLEAIAALTAGAASAVANDTDPAAAVAARLNATANAVPLATSTDDLLDSEPDADLILIGDLVYEPALESRVARFLAAARRRGIPVLFGDRATSRLPEVGFVLVDTYETVVAPPLEEDWVETARVWRLDP